jgi:hypothetical protein
VVRLVCSSDLAHGPIRAPKGKTAPICLGLRRRTLARPNQHVYRQKIPRLARWVTRNTCTCHVGTFACILVRRQEKKEKKKKKITGGTTNITVWPGAGNYPEPSFLCIVKQSLYVFARSLEINGIGRGAMIAHEKVDAACLLERDMAVSHMAHHIKLAVGGGFVSSPATA